jgi:hypothetical protein
MRTKTARSAQIQMVVFSSGIQEFQTKLRPASQAPIIAPD